MSLICSYFQNNKSLLLYRLTLYYRTKHSLFCKFAIVIVKYFSFQKLSKEDKDSYNDGVYKIGKIAKANQRYRILGFLGLFVALFVFVPISLSMIGPETNIFWHTKFVSTFWDSTILITELYILLYFLSRIIFEYVYIRKGIKEDKKLTPRERELLERYYTKSPIRYIGTALLLEFIPALFEIITSTGSGSII